jgi:hypothetical protein
VKSHIDSDLTDAQYGIPGTSKNNANVVAYFEKYGFGLRVGYTYRSPTLLATGAGFPLPLIQAATGNLDANLTYAITKHIELTASAVNITRETRKEYLGTPTALVNYYDRPVVYTFGGRVSF